MSLSIVEIHLKGGTSFSFRTTSLEMKREPLFNKVTTMTWNKLQGEKKLVDLDLEDISAILVTPVSDAPDADSTSDARNSGAAEAVRKFDEFKESSG